MGSPKAARPGLQLDGREGEVWRRTVINRWPQARVAAELGISQQRVSQIVKAVREAIVDDSLAELRRDSLEFYHDMMARALEVAELTPAPVTVGQDGIPLVDPETGEWVRDFGGRLRAIETAAKMEAEIRKLLGLDAATKLESTAVVKYEVVGVSVEALK